MVIVFKGNGGSVIVGGKFVSKEPAAVYVGSEHIYTKHTVVIHAPDTFHLPGDDSQNLPPGLPDNGNAPEHDE